MMQTLHVIPKLAQVVRVDPSNDSRPRIEAVGVALIAGAFLLDCLTPVGFAGGMLYMVPVVLGLWAHSRYVMTVAVVTTVLTIFGLYVPVPEQTIPWTAYLNRVGAIFSVWVTALGVLSYRRITAKLVRSEAESRAILDGAVEGIVTIDERGAIRTFNRAAEKMFGLNSSDVTGENVSILMPSPHREQHDHYLKRYLESGRAHVIGIGRELTALRADGSEFPIEISLAETRGADGRIFTAVIRDITEAKRAHAAREQLLAQLELKNAELERFTYTVSHDLKSPLITIKGFLGMLEKDARAGNTERMKSDLARIASAADHMKDLLEDLLELSRIGRIANPHENVPLQALANEAAALLSAALERRAVSLVIDPELPVVRGDRLRLREALQNLLENAVKFLGEQQEPRIEVGCRGEGEQQVFFVRDNGVGIDPNYHDTVFGLFEKIDARAEGTGVGLALVKRIIEVHGGRIWVESAGLGRGATFCFTLAAPTEVATNCEACT